MELLDIFEVNAIVSEFDFFSLEISATTGAKFLFTKITNKEFKEFSILAIRAQLRAALQA